MWISFLLALIPIIWLIYSLAIRKMPAIKACSIGLLITIVLAILGFNLSIVDTLSGCFRGHSDGAMANCLCNRGCTVYL